MLTEIETQHRKLLETTKSFENLAPDHKGLSWTLDKLVPAVAAHDRLRDALSEDELLLIDFRRHSAAHVNVNAYRVSLNSAGMIDGSKVTILDGKFLTVAEKDTLLDTAKRRLGDDNDRAARAIAERIIPFLQQIIAFATPLHTPTHWKYRRVHVVETGDGTWADIARAARVDLARLLEANRGSTAESSPEVGKIIVVPD